MNNNIKLAFRETDWLLYITCIITSIFGALCVFSATRNDAIADDIFISRECIIMICAFTIGIILCAIISYFDYNSILRSWPIVAGFCLLLVFALFIWGEAPADRPNAKCWLPIIKTSSFVVNFQPSELAKVGFIVSFTAHIDSVKNEINSIKNVILLTIHALIPIGLIILTDDLGSAMVFAFMFIGMMFTAGLNLRYFAIAIGAFAAVTPILWTKFLSTFHRQRILAIYYPEALNESTLKNVIYQQQRCVNAIGSGGLFGDGFLQGTYTQSASGIPVNESDMVFSVVGEEFGLLGALGLILVLFFICFKLIKIGKSSHNLTGTLICFGTAFMIASQSLLNIGMCLKLLPCIGITLPFVSAGGSSNMCVYFAIGLSMSVYRFNKERELQNFSAYGLKNIFDEY